MNYYNATESYKFLKINYATFKNKLSEGLIPQPTKTEKNDKNRRVINLWSEDSLTKARLNLDKEKQDKPKTKSQIKAIRRSKLEGKRQSTGSIFNQILRMPTPGKL